MSKQKSAKASQNWQKKPVFNTCSNCDHFKLERIRDDKGYGVYYKETLTCTLGNFKTGKTSTCDRHTVIATDNEIL